MIITSSNAVEVLTIKIGKPAIGMHQDWQKTEQRQTAVASQSQTIVPTGITPPI